MAAHSLRILAGPVDDIPDRFGGDYCSPYGITPKAVVVVDRGGDRGMSEFHEHHAAGHRDRVDGPSCSPNRRSDRKQSIACPAISTVTGSVGHHFLMLSRATRLRTGPALRGAHVEAAPKM